MKHNGPTIWIEDKGSHVWECFKNYKAALKAVRRMIDASANSEAVIFRKRRGQWGEWREVWRIIDNKPKIVDQGWM
jgi:hypothetical protein